MKHNQTRTRTLFAAAERCPFGCKYCFIKFNRYKVDKPTKQFAHDQISDDQVSYPTCDGEFFSDPHAVSELERLVHETTHRVLVSISVKSPVSHKRAQFLKNMNAILVKSRRGLIKCSVSISGKSKLNEYEPRTPGFEQRISTLENLSEEGIPTSVNLKPILPFISDEEYREIVYDTSTYVTAYLLGGLYIDPTNSFGKKIIKNHSRWISGRTVNWLPNQPVWQYCENPEQMASIRSHIVHANRKFFENDLDVMAHLIALS